MTAAVGAVLLYPLLRGARMADDGRSGEQAVYRDQLRELDRDLNGGLISKDEASYARAEIGRRLIAISGEAVAADAQSGGNHRLTQAFIIVLLPIVGLCLYLAVGHPGLPSQPLSTRLEKPGDDLAILVSQAERHLAEHPDDGRGWDVLAPIYFKTQRLGDAELAYRNAIRLRGQSAERLGGLAETLIATAGGIVTDEAQDVLRQALALEPDNPRARFYLALALEQGGKAAEARDAFVALESQSPADAPWLPLVNEHIAKNGGLPATAEAGLGAAAPGNPTAADVASSEAMSAGDRMQIIRGMVDGLDARLKDNPDNFEGWTRLIRSYAVLKETGRASDALKRALAAFPTSGAQGQRLLALAKELGISAEETAQ
jgi:cytochrome c-type biogenesis protein CcmH